MLRVTRNRPRELTLLVDCQSCAVVLVRLPSLAQDGIIYQDVDVARVGEHLVAEFLHRRFPREIEPMSGGAEPFRAEVIRGTLALREVARGEGHVGAGFGEGAQHMCLPNSPLPPVTTATLPDRSDNCGSGRSVDGARILALPGGYH